MSIKVLIADDHPLVRDGLRFTIERSGGGIEIIGMARDGVEALRLAEECPAEVYILDITMPNLNGLETSRAIIKRCPGAKIIILSIHNTRGFVEEAIEAGASGYLTKEAASGNIVKAIREVNEGRRYFSPDIRQFNGNRKAGMRRARGTKGLSALTTQERRVLQYVAEGKTAGQIAAILGRSIETIRVHRKNLMAKLDIHKQTDLVRFAVKEGLVKV